MDIRFAVIQFRQSFSFVYVVLVLNGVHRCSWYLEMFFVCVLTCTENGIAISYILRVLLRPAEVFKLRLQR